MLRAVRNLVEELQRYSIELGVVRSLLGKCEVSDRVGSCKEIVRRNVRYLFVLGVVRILLGEWRGI